MSKTIGLILALEDKCSPQLQKVAEKLDLTTEQAKAMHNRFVQIDKQLRKNLKEAAKIAGAGLAAMTAASAVLITKTVEAGDRIDKMSQKMQMSRKTFQELDYVFSQNGANIESMSKGMVKLSKNITEVRKGNKNAIETFKQLGVSIKDSRGQIRKSEDIFLDIISSLQKMPDNANRSALATQLLGKSASELAPLLNSGAKSVDDLRQKFKDLGLGMSDKSIDSAVKFKDSMDSISRSLQGAGFEIAGEFLPSVQKVADTIIANMPKIKATVTPVIKGILDIVNATISSMNIWMPVLAGVVAGLGTFKAITGVIATIKSFKLAIEGATLASKMWGLVVSANPIGMVAVGLAIAIPLLVTAYNKFEGFRKCVQAAWSVTKLLGATIVMVAKYTWDFLKPIAMVGVKILSWVTPIGIVAKLIANLFQYLRKVISAMGGLRAIGENVKNWADNTREKISVANKISKHATGTMFAPGGLSLVGENGPELLNLPRGSQVFNNHETKNMMSKDITINLNIGGNVIGNDDFIAQISNVLGRQLATALAV